MEFRGGAGGVGVVGAASAVGAAGSGSVEGATREGVDGVDGWVGEERFEDVRALVFISALVLYIREREIGRDE